MKFIIKRVTSRPSFYAPYHNDETKKIKLSELKEHLNNGWKIVRKEYFIITYLSESWSKLTLNQKISIIGIILTILITVIVA